ncbi:MAG: phosphatase PAP2 family protein [Opitutus sp.]|nr:phosphatase PAP2 family protein [Opitutus sp.]
MKMTLGRVFHLVLAAGLLLAVPSMGSAQNVMVPAAAGAPRFLEPTALDWANILPAPPAPGSLAAAADLETMLQVQGTRTADDIAWAKLVEKDKVFLNASVLGAWFTPDRLPAMAALFERISSDIRALDPAMKKFFPRARPSRGDARVQPCVQLPASDTYPSGSALQAHAWAMVLAEIFPEHRVALEARAHRAAWGRVIGGVHFPTDLEGGRRVAVAYVAVLRQSAEFRAALERARAEAAAFVMKKAA